MRKIIIGNWKMNKTNEEAICFVRELKRLVKEIKGIDIVVCPPFTALSDVVDELKNSSIDVGAQNMFYAESGAFTGEISPLMLNKIGCKYVIIGHSERRQYFNETDEIVNKKIKLALQNDLIPIVCIGETLEQRESNKAEKIVKNQIKNGFENLKKEDILRLVIAYEPVWAIGTGKTATSEQAQAMHAFIRKLLADFYGKDMAKEIRILYGGSIKPNNIKDLMTQKDIDGGLVGGASLEVKSFLEIIKQAKG